MYQFLFLVTTLPVFITNAAPTVEMCTETQFQCNDRSCINKELTCNGAVNCPDASDEDFVLCRTKECDNNQFKCTYGACVVSNAICNGIKDCADNSDELLLKCRNETTYFECLNNIITNNYFVLNPLVQTRECLQKDLHCKNGQMIKTMQKCDGVAHCNDGSDESLETCASSKCFRSLFRCKYGACVHGDAMCNGVKDCADGSDELEELCHTNNSGLCVLPPFPKNGYYGALELPNLHPGQTSESLHFNFSCNTGYKLVGNPSPYCLKGWWSDSSPRCISQCTLNKHPSVEYLCLPKNSSSNHEPKECDDLVEDDTVVRPKCREPNYYYSGVLVNMHCIDGVWDQVTTCSPQCGLVTSEGDQLIVGGRSAMHGELPWHTGIYAKTSKPYKQICGGSLISTTVVISAAHCFWSDLYKQLPVSDYAVAVGKLYRPWNVSRDKDAQKSDVLEIKIPPRFQGAAANYQEDIAIVTVTTPFQFHTYVRPVCIDFDYSFSRRQLHIGASGKVAGWGLTTEDGKESPVLKVVELPYVDIEQCVSASPPGFVEYITSDKICAGVINGTVRSVCKGDSGGGLVFRARERGADRYFLRGVVSTAPTSEHLCNTNVYTTFTQVTKHEEFIRQYL